MQGLHGGQLKHKLQTKEQKNDSTGAKHWKLMASKVSCHLTHSIFCNENQKLHDEDDRGVMQKAIKKLIWEVKAERVLWRKCETI